MDPDLVRPNVRAMHGYVPGEQPDISDRVVKLNTNENPFPPSPRVLQALRDIEPETLRRYPSPSAEGFREVAARVLGLTPDMILCGNGSDDVLTVITRCFVPPGGTLAFPDPTYSLYGVLAAIEDARTAAVPWGANWSLPINGLLATQADAIYIANPNAPTGTLVAPDEISKLAAEFPGVVLIDEAYADFTDQNCLDLVGRHANVIVSRTMSKAYSLAGMRFGFAVSNAAIIEQMAKVKDSYNCDAVSILAATAAIEDQDYARSTWLHVRQERDRVGAALAELGFDVLPSHANFVFVTPPDADGRGLYERLKAMGIIVRHFDKPGLADKIRITIGTMQENNALLGGVADSLTPAKV